MNMKYIFLLLHLFFLQHAMAQNVPTSGNMFSTILERVHREQMENVTDVQVLDSLVKADIASLHMESGKWQAFDYSDHKRISVSWLPVLEKMRRMTVAYTHPNSSYYQSEQLWQAVNNSLGYFTNHKPLPYCDNWYQQGVTRPQSLTLSLINMKFGKRSLDTAVEKSTTRAICIDTAVTSNGRNNPTHKYNFGANKALIAKGWIWIGALLENQTMLETGVREVYGPIAYTTGEGIQYDLSYDMHYGYLYNGAYGVDFMTSVVQTAWYTKDTPYALQGEKLDLFREFILESIFGIIRGQWIDWNVLGRGISRTGATKQDHSDLLMKLMDIDSLNREQYWLIYQRMCNEKPVDAGIKPQHRHYWHTDYTVHTRPSYTLSIHAVSSRNFSQEIGNQENLKGYWGAQGTMNLQVRGDEYYNVFPWWDWARLPGTTLPDTVPIAMDKAPGSGDRRGTHAFAGGVSDSLYGATAYVIEGDMHTSAKKSWFMFDNEIVCLGAGIYSTLNYPINTTLNQTRLSNEGVYWKAWNRRTTTRLVGKSQMGDDIQWVWHDSVGYVFPYRQPVDLLAGRRWQSWSAIRGNGDDDNDQRSEKAVFQLSMPHSKQPHAAKYAYILLPATSPQDMPCFLKKKPVSIMFNTEDLQAVYHHKLQIWQMVFYTGGISYQDKDIEVWTDVPSLVLLKKEGRNAYNIHVSDPTQQQAKIKLSIKRRGKPKVQTLDIDMPKQHYAGQSRQASIIL